MQHGVSLLTQKWNGAMLLAREAELLKGVCTSCVRSAKAKYYLTCMSTEMYSLPVHEGIQQTQMKVKMQYLLPPSGLSER